MGAKGQLAGCPAGKVVMCENFHHTVTLQHLGGHLQSWCLLLPSVCDFPGVWFSWPEVYKPLIVFWESRIFLFMSDRLQLKARIPSTTLVREATRCKHGAKSWQRKHSQTRQTSRPPLWASHTFS